MYFLLTSLCLSQVSSLNIKDFGAVSFDASLTAALKNGMALNAAIQAANSTDKLVTVSPGEVYTMLPAGTISNLVDVTFQLDGSIIAWGGPEEDWPTDSKGGVLTLLCFEYTDGLVIQGSGLIDGQGYLWWWKTILTAKDNRPVLLQVGHSKNTLIDGITVKNSPKYNVDLYDVLNMTVQNIVIHVDITDEKGFLRWIPTFPLNTDGIDIRGRDIVFRNMTIQNFDDAVAVKPTHRNEDIYSNCTENLLIENCAVKYGVGMSIGSVPPNDDHACIRNVTIRNIVFDMPLKAIYIKPNPGTHGTGEITNIVYENIDIYDAIWWAIWIGPQQQDQPGGYTTGCSFLFPLPGKHCPTDPLVTIDTITLRNINIHGGVLSPGVLLCNSTNPCTNFIFDNVNVYHRSLFPVPAGFYCENVQGRASNSNLWPKCLTYVSEEEEMKYVEA